MPKGNNSGAKKAEREGSAVHFLPNRDLTHQGNQKGFSKEQKLLREEIISIAQTLYPIQKVLRLSPQIIKLKQRVLDEKIEQMRLTGFYVQIIPFDKGGFKFSCREIPRAFVNDFGRPPIDGKEDEQPDPIHDRRSSLTP